MVVDKNEDWGIWCVHVVGFYLQKECENRGLESYTLKD
jgi:hypothetical protein